MALWPKGFTGSDRPYRDGPREAELSLVEKFDYRDGSGVCLRFADEAGYCIVWFTKRRLHIDVGDRIRATFTIKSHREYNGVRENVTKSFNVIEVL